LQKTGPARKQRRRRKFDLADFDQDFDVKAQDGLPLALKNQVLHDGGRPELFPMDAGYPFSPGSSHLHFGDGGDSAPPAKS
jgi:hypothetical protein